MGVFHMGAPVSVFPKQDYKSMVAYYGEPGTNQTQITLPYPMRIAWDTKVTVRKLTCHKKVAASLLKILTEIWEHCGKDLKKVQEAGLDLFGGCLNVRKMRGGDQWSVHSWGAAIDLDPDRNQLKWGRDRAKMPEWAIEIFERNGWVSLGKRKNMDFMHFQAAML